MTASIGDRAVAGPSTTAGPGRSLTALRIAALLVVAVAFAQPVLAGLFIAGTADVTMAHGIVGDTVWFTALIQLITAIVYVWKGRGRTAALYASIALLVTAFATSVLGWIGGEESRDLLAVHIPLAFAVIAGQLVFTLWTFHGSAREARPVRG